jgi:hypothetical protein
MYNEFYEIFRENIKANSLKAHNEWFLKEDVTVNGKKVEICVCFENLLAKKQ